MSTRSVIQVGDKAIYCHSDGYPDGVGAHLQRHYTDKDKAEKLVSHGAMSSIGAVIGDKVDFNDRAVTDGNLPDGSWGQCRFYHRDRGEDLSIIDPATLTDNPDSWPGTEYLYVYEDKLEAWLCYEITSKPRPGHEDADPGEMDWDEYCRARQTERVLTAIPEWHENETYSDYRQRLTREEAEATKAA